MGNIPLTALILLVAETALSFQEQRVTSATANYVIILLGRHSQTQPQIVTKHTPEERRPRRQRQRLMR